MGVGVAVCGCVWGCEGVGVHVGVWMCGCVGVWMCSCMGECEEVGVCV